MATMFRSAMVLCCALLLAACGKQEEAEQAAAQPAAAAPLTAPASGDNAAWREYLVSVAKQHMQGIRSNPYMYYLPSTEDPEFDQKYARQLEQVEGVIARTVLPGNMLAFGSPESGRMADLVETSFSNWAEANAFKGVRVLFIGKEEDRARVEAAVQPSGAEFVFVEAR